MKLHLPGKLRAALLACYAISASLVTTVSTGTVTGGALAFASAVVLSSQQAEAVEYYSYAGGKLTNFAYGSSFDAEVVGDVTFAEGDSITFLGDTTMSLGSDVKAGVFSVTNGVVLDISSDGYTLTSGFDLVDGVLRLSSSAISEDSVFYSSTSGRVEIAWGGSGGSLAAAMTSYTGIMDVNASRYNIKDGESGYYMMTVRGEDATLAFDEATYSLPIHVMGAVTFDSMENVGTHTGRLTGFGTITKVGEGVYATNATSDYYIGDLVIEEGMVRWGAPTDDVNASGSATNRMAISNIIVKEGATFEDSHVGVYMGDVTTMTLEGGTLRSFNMNPVPTGSDNVNNVSYNTYKALYVKGEGFIDVVRIGGHRFMLLSSLEPDPVEVEDGLAQDELTEGMTEATLTISNGETLSGVDIRRVENFHGTITGDNMDDDHKLYLGEIHQDADYDLTVTLATDASSIVKTGEGSATLGNAVDAVHDITVKEGSLSVVGTIDAERIDVQGGTMTASDVVNLRRYHQSGGEFAAEYGQPDGFTVRDEMTISGGELQIKGSTSDTVVTRQLNLLGGDVVFAGNLQAGDVVMGDATVDVQNTMVVDSFVKSGKGTITLSAHEDTTQLTVRENLVMNYAGTAESFNGGDFKNMTISLQDNAVLTYNPAKNKNVIEFYSPASTQGANLYVDVFDVSAEDLSKGINLGFFSSCINSIEKIKIPTLGKKGEDYVIELNSADGFYYLRTLKGQVATTEWDMNWGRTEVSRAPETVNQWFISSIDDTGLYKNGEFDNQHYIACELIGSNAEGNAVFGGAYGTRGIDASGGTVQRQIWLKATGGEYALIVAGNYCDNTSLAAWNLEGDTHVFIGEGASVGTVIGGNFLGAHTPEWVGDGFITIDSSNVTGSVIGGGLDATLHVGDNTVIINKALKTNENTVITDFTLGDTEYGRMMSINGSAIVTGVSSGVCEWIGDGLLLVDLKNDTTKSKMAKHLIGGNLMFGGTSTHQGNSTVIITNIGDRLFSNTIVAGDMIVDAGGSYTNGHTSLHLSNFGDDARIGGSSYSSNNPLVVGSSYGVNSNYQFVQQEWIQQGNASVTIENVGSATFNSHVVAGYGFQRGRNFAGDDVQANNHLERTFVGVIDGDTNITIDSGLYRGMVVGGIYYEDYIHDSYPENPGTLNTASQYNCPDHSRPDSLTITGTSNVNITGGTYRNTVIGATYYDGWDDLTMYTYGSNVNIKNAKLNGANNPYRFAVVGAYYIDEYIHELGVHYSGATGCAHAVTFTVETEVYIGDVNVTLANSNIEGVILGGSLINRASPADPSGVIQGHVTLDLQSGNISADVYAAGAHLSDVDFYTETTTVKISDQVVFGDPEEDDEEFTISGGYMGGGTATVHGNTTLVFGSENTTYSNLDKLSFIFFDVVEVTDANTTVTLPHNANRLGDFVTKTGAGTLVLGQQNDLDLLTVKEGRLKLAANSIAAPNGTKIELLQVAKGATLDLTAGNCGINGVLALEGGSHVDMSYGAGAADIGRLLWDDSAPVCLTIAGLSDTSETYEIELFTGLSKADIIGIDMNNIDGVGYAAKAALYIDGPANLLNSYLVLRDDTLLLVKAPRRTLYWEFEGGTSGNWMANNAWAKIDEGTPDAEFCNDPGADNVVFSNNDATITVGEVVRPYDINVVNGEYIFAGINQDSVIELHGSLILSEGASATFDDLLTLKTSPEVTVFALQDEDCTLEVNNDVDIYYLHNRGEVTINGTLSLATETDEGGILMAQNLKVGGDSLFKELTVTGSVMNNEGYTLTVGGDSSIGAIDGGTLNVSKGGNVFIAPANGQPETTTLTALKGYGSVETINDMVLKENSEIGSISARSLETRGTLAVNGDVLLDDTLAVSSTATIAGNLTVSEIKFNDLYLTSKAPVIDVERDVISTAADGTIAVTVDLGLIATQILTDDKEYYMVKCDEIDRPNVFINGETRYELSNARYDYSVYAKDDGVVVVADVTNYHLFESVSDTLNGRTGAQLLDELYRDATLVENHPNGDLRSVLESINQQLLVNNSKEGLDNLFAAVAGASIPSLGMAFGDDMSRQLKAIRNRTTTMGVDQSAVNEDMPYFNAWINAEGNSQKLDLDGTSSGYDLSNWGGTVGFDVDFSPRLTAGLAVTSMSGDFTADSPDMAEGDLDTQYVTAFARYTKRSWVHTFVASVGRADISLDRTVTHDNGAYTTRGETDGMGFGFMYEVGHVRKLNETGSACIQPVANITFTHTCVDGYAETNSDAALKVDDITMTSVTMGLGARIQATVGENVYNRASIFEARAMAKLYAGDRQGTTSVSFAGAAMSNGQVESAERGVVGLEVGAGVTIPLGADHHAIFFDASAEINAGYTAINGTVGYRLNF